MLSKLLNSVGSGTLPRVRRRLKRDFKRLKHRLLGTTPTIHVDHAPGLTRTVVKPAISFDLVRPLGFNDADWRVFSDAAVGHIRPSHILDLKGGFVFGPDSWPMTAEGKAVLGMWVPQVNIPGDDYNIMAIPRYDRDARARAQHLPGLTVTLNQMGGANYFHFILHCLTRLALIQEEVSLTDVDHFILPPDVKGFMREWLGLAGVPEHKIRPMVKEGYACDRLLVTDNPGPFNIPPPWAVNWLNGLVPIDNETTFPKRIFVTRNDTSVRRLLNLDEIEPILLERGFEPITLGGRSVVEQASLFHHAEAIAGVHGAALANLVFTRPGTKMIELLPKNHLEPCFWFIGQQRQLDHTILLGQEKPLLVGRWRRSMMADLSIDPATLISCLDQKGL